MAFVGQQRYGIGGGGGGGPWGKKPPQKIRCKGRGILKMDP